jgi:hypothetical protein
MFHRLFISRSLYCTAAASVTENFDGLLVNVQILLFVCQNCLNQLDFNKPVATESSSSCLATLKNSLYKFIEDRP